MTFEGKQFGRRARADEPRATPSDRPIGPALPVHVVLVLGLLSLFLAGFAFRWALPEIATLNGDEAQAERNVVAIVNQPVTHLPRTAEAGVFSPGWFHAGAEKPDFGSVDIRETQEFPYARYAYVTSDVNPTEMFIGSELEFNAMTKYFYTDRTIPKKRLSDREMIEINHLYRVIGRDERALTMWWAAISGVLALVLVVATVLVLARRTPLIPGVDLTMRSKP